MLKWLIVCQIGLAAHRKWNSSLAKIGIVGVYEEVTGSYDTAGWTTRSRHRTARFPPHPQNYRIGGGGGVKKPPVALFIAHVRFVVIFNSLPLSVIQWKT